MFFVRFLSSDWIPPTAAPKKLLLIQRIGSLARILL